MTHGARINLPWRGHLSRPCACKRGTALCRQTRFAARPQFVIRTALNFAGADFILNRTQGAMRIPKRPRKITYGTLPRGRNRQRKYRFAQTRPEGSPRGDYGANNQDSERPQVPIPGVPGNSVPAQIRMDNSLAATGRKGQSGPAAARVTLPHLRSLSQESGNPDGTCDRRRKCTRIRTWTSGRHRRMQLGSSMAALVCSVIGSGAGQGAVRR